MYHLPQTTHKTNGNPFFSAGLKKTEGTLSLKQGSAEARDAPLNERFYNECINLFNELNE